MRSSGTDFRPRNGEPYCPENNYRARAGNNRYSAVQHGDLNRVCAFSIETIDNLCPDGPLARDEPPFDDVNIIDKLSATPKQTCPAAPDGLLEPELEDLCSTKRRRLAEQRAESVMLNPIPTSDLTSPLTPSGCSATRASNVPNPGFLNSSGQGNSPGTPQLTRNDLVDAG
ncbi:hypothetical protein BU23DRAFT_633842 [Bimuria novae-zelandiae CBS 107.79]|uniref:Uncharacterized protein n=1 Tax=Bimuria novae-zelandiae CBS 107.79 TaxID=1447943 RepID=A0A6A5VEK9_9PLEO|nr:hypothetical protein BU23DRAFT_633842 [Bimuria novae-zelandiae CBS 107.79]